MEVNSKSIQGRRMNGVRFISTQCSGYTLHSLFSDNNAFLTFLSIFSNKTKLKHTVFTALIFMFQNTVNDCTPTDSSMVRAT